MSENDEYGVAIVDRIESGTAVLEMIDPNFVFEFPLELLPEDLHEGSAVEVNFKERPEVEEARRERINDLQNELIEKPDDEE